jgi:hypothetical protein
MIGQRRTGALLALVGLTGAAAIAAVAHAGPAAAHPGPDTLFQPGNLLVSRSVYEAGPGILTAGSTVLPPGCTSDCVTATADGTYPEVWNNVLPDANFGVTSPVFLDQLTPSGRFVDSLEVPGGKDSELVTSFSSKSELALNQSTDGKYVTFMGYVAPTDAIDVSNSNTPGVIDPTDPVPGANFRAVAQVDARGNVQVTETNAYSGNNGRAAILDDTRGAHAYFTAGNAGNGSNPQPVGVIAGTGLQLVRPTAVPQHAQHPGATTPLGSFSVTQLGDKADKVGKDTNFRGLTVFDNVVYTTKGSGSNGVNTIYFVDTTGRACPTGVGVPQPGAALPTKPLPVDPATAQTQGLPNNMCVLAGFPTEEKSDTAFPFGLWFANPNTLYVADEGDGDTTFSPATGTYTAAAAQTSAGLQKWVRTNGTWHLADTLSAGLGLGVPYHVPGYPTGTNAATGLPWSPATDGLRNITGRVNRDGTVTIWGLTSTVSGDGDQGADPNRLVTVTDRPGATTPGGQRFTTVRTAPARQVLRGVSFTPGTRH